MSSHSQVRDTGGHNDEDDERTMWSPLRFSYLFLLNLGFCIIINRLLGIWQILSPILYIFSFKHHTGAARQDQFLATIKHFSLASFWIRKYTPMKMPLLSSPDCLSQRLTCIPASIHAWITVRVPWMLTLSNSPRSSLAGAGEAQWKTKDTSFRAGSRAWSRTRQRLHNWYHASQEPQIRGRHI